MADDLFGVLIKVRDAAETANACAREIINDYGRDRRYFNFDWAAHSICEHTEQAQRRAAARDKIRHQYSCIKRLCDAEMRLGEGTQPALDLIRRAVGLRVPPIRIGDNTYPTAHEAAAALGEMIHEAWEEAGGYDAVERAPDRLHAEYGGDDADIAIEVSVEIWKRLRRLRKKGLPPDLWGQIQQEYEAAWDRLEAETATDGKRGRATSRIDRGEANLRARVALKSPKIDSVRKLAKAIGCSTGLASQLPAWRAHQEELAKKGKKKAGGPRACSLTDGILAGKGQDDPELERLIAEQQTDYEESPLVSHARKHRRRPKV
jgi:hypothetical protein